MFAEVMWGITCASSPIVYTPKDSPRSQLRSTRTLLPAVNRQPPSSQRTVEAITGRHKSERHPITETPGTAGQATQNFASQSRFLASDAR